MKFATGLLMCFFAFSSFAGSVEEKVKDVEADRNVKCEYVKTSVGICLGSPVTLTPALCRYSKTFNCDGAETFKLKVKVKGYYNQQTNGYEEKVIGTTITTKG